MMVLGVMMVVMMICDGVRGDDDDGGGSGLPNDKCFTALESKT